MRTEKNGNAMLRSHAVYHAVDILGAFRVKTGGGFIQNPETLLCKNTAPGAFELQIQSEEEIPAIVRKIVEQGGDVYHISAELPSLEDIYFHLTGKEQTT